MAHSTTLVRRQAQLEALIDAAEARIVKEGVEGLKARALAADIGIALGGLYNIVDDMDMLILMIADRSLRRLDAALRTATDAVTDGKAPVTHEEALISLEATGFAYLDFARRNLRLWRALFEMRLSKPDLPEWNRTAQLGLFGHIAPPIRHLMPQADETAQTLTARTLFAAVHGIVLFGLEERLIAVPKDALQGQISWLIRSLFPATTRS